MAVDRPIPATLQCQTVCEAFQLVTAERPNEVALRTKSDEVSITFGEYAERVRRIAGGLHALGVKKGDTIAIMLSNRPEFHLVDAAVMHLGSISFSVYNSSPPEQIRFMLQDAGSNVLITEAQFYYLAKAGVELADRTHQIIVADDFKEGALHLDELQLLNPGNDFDFDASWRAVQPEDLITLIYTSGTTGVPKGVEITHANVVAQMRGVEAVLRRGSGGASISFLPAAHVGERVLVHYNQMFMGNSLTSCPNLSEVYSHIIDARPTSFGSVPRIWEKMKAALELEIEADSAIRDKYKNAIALGVRKIRAEQAGDEIPASVLAEYDLAEQEVYSRIRERLGLDRCEVSFMGAAPPSADVLEFFAAIGIRMTEIWGMSETAGTVTILPPDNFKMGTVGPPMPGLEVKLAGDGEALVRGPTVMRGYRNMPETTAETIVDGWLHTGDIATIDNDGFLKIIGRKKDIIISSSGKNMSPSAIESKVLANSSIISQVIVIGDGRPYNVALIGLASDLVSAFAEERGLDKIRPDPENIHPKIHEEVKYTIERANKELSRPEQIKKFKIVGVDWLPGGDELTPTLKVKRSVVYEKYKSEIDELYEA